MGGPPYASTPAKWAGAVQEDETMFKKKQLLPKDLAARAEKVDPAKVEAEVLRIISAKPGRGQVTGTLSPWAPLPSFGPVPAEPWPAHAMQEMARLQALQQASQLQYTSIGQTPWISLTGGSV
jgi:hypothetical protein